MSSEAIRPSTLEGIKRLAKSIKVERGIQHATALDDAAHAAGFQNFRHAKSALSGAKAQLARPRSGHCLFITVYWKDRAAGQGGRETLRVWLSVPWDGLVSPAQLKNHRALMSFRSEGPDHLVRRTLVRSQSSARREACAAARTFCFMDATKLRPSKSYSRAYPGGRATNAVPGRDHHSIWYDRETKRYLFADEPYEEAAKHKAAERAAWSHRHGFVIAKPEWRGMYNPDGGSQLYLIAEAAKGIPLEPIAAALNRLPPPIVEETWDGESAPTLPYFVSPGAVAKAQAEKVQPRPSRKASGQLNTVGYVWTFVGPQRRPKGRMPVEAHLEVADKLKSVLVASSYRKGVYNRIDSVRSELDEWVRREYSYTEVPDEHFFDLYYQESDTTFARSISAEDRQRHLANLARVREVLAEHYPDCAPLRAVLKRVDSAAKSLLTW
jgi:hypothetical protein